MFNKKDVSFEIAQSMERALVANAVNKQTEGLDKLAEAMEHLNVAAEIFDGAGLRKHAEAATQLLESLAARKSKKKPSKSKKSKLPAKSKKSKPAKHSKKQSPKSDSATKGLTSDKMLDNLEHKGWVFNVDDGEDESFADDNFSSHGDDCMCSMCMDSDDMNYLRHGDDCMCSMCMDSDDVNDMKLDVSGRGGSSSSDPEYWRHMAAKYTRENDLRKAEEALTRALEAEKSERYDSGEDSAFDDDFNFDFDTSRDSGYHVDRDSEEYDDDLEVSDFNFVKDNYTDLDYELENELKRQERKAILPPPPDSRHEIPNLDTYKPSSKSWKDIEETSRDTIPATPIAKRHHRLKW